MICSKETLDIIPCECYECRRKKNEVLDLFSGLGGASEAFLSSGHDVVRIENNPLLSEVPNTQSMCVFELRDFLEAKHEIQNCDKEQLI
jgi:hypothetical protein